MKVTSGNSRLAGDFGDDKWPPGFRFHPTDEELVLYYLKRKICKRRLRLDIIRVLDVYKWDPEELPWQSILKTGDRQWFFFSPRDRKYPNGGRSNRATRHGYWKATGKDRNITCSCRNVGIKKTLVFYRGRAPNGERTDWVMHEYTLDEEELKRCLNAQDYYALYKVYKKSGPGPKNGEQYGAPFKEEDWADDDCAGVVTSVAPVEQQNVAAPPPDNTKATAQVELPLTFEDFMNQISGENPFDLLEIADYANGLQQVASEGETQSTLVDPSCREVIFSETVSVLPTNDQQCGKERSLDFNQSATSKIQTRDAAEVTSVPTSSGGPLICGDDFLEIDDLIGPKPTTVTSPEKLVEKLGFDDFDGLTEYDLFLDAPLFLNGMGPVEQDTVSHVSTFSELQSHSLSNQVDYHLQPRSNITQVDSQLQSHLDANGVDYLQPHSTVNNVNYLQSSAFGEDELWEPYQRSGVFAITGSLHETPTEATSGVAINESTNNLIGANQHQSGEEDVGSAGWFSSTLWALVESIPTTPASASENPLVNKAFERMSSLSRIRMNVKNNNGNADNLNARIHAADAKKTGGSRGFLFLSIFGALCAILWVLVGTVRVLGRSTS